MLDRPKLLKEFTKISDKLFLDTSHEYQLAQKVWEEIADDSTFAYKIKTLKSPWILPSWVGKLNETIPVAQINSPYAVLAVDGSQIYPDRHQGIACYLINVGFVQLAYGIVEEKPLLLESRPHIFLSHVESESESTVQDGSADAVNCLREEYELRAGFEQGLLLKEKMGNQPYAVLFDGSLIFWHLESKDEAIKEKFLSTYLHIMHQFFQARIPMASYISFPKSKELVNLIRVALCKFELEGCTEHKAVDHIVDAQVARFFLNQGERTIIFQNHSAISSLYPDHLKPHFFYLHVGQEVIRVEIPAWIAEDAEQVRVISEIIFDQAMKGRGYPVCLAEAHEQAVIKGPDREFFYHVLQKAGIEQKQRYAISQKSLKKRGIGV
jgi:hypothetical protein